MKSTGSIRHPLSRRVYRIVRWLVCLILIVMVLALAGAIYLNVHGVPEPLVRRIVNRIQEKGIPMELDSIHLSLRGLCADNVRLFIGIPDNPEPVLFASEVFLRRIAVPGKEIAEGMCYDLVLNSLEVTPPGALGVDIQERQGIRHVEKVQLTLCLAPDRVLIRNGSTRWRDLKLKVDGTVLRHPAAAKEPGQAQAALMLASEILRQAEQALEDLELAEAADVTIDFWIDPADQAANHGSLVVEAGKLSYRNVPFSRFKVAAEYAHPDIILHQAELLKNNDALVVAGSYHMDRNEMEVRVSNEITSHDVYDLLPQKISDVFSKIAVHPDTFPLADLVFGPSEPTQMLQHLSGTFSLERALIGDLEVNELQGRISTTAQRLSISELSGKVLGQERRAGEADSSLMGGSASGEIFWDAASHEFGVHAKGSFDPNLLLSPLAPVRIATNVIDRFKFDGLPPRFQLEMGACYDDWRSYFLSLSAEATDMRYHGVPFSSVKASAYYSRGVVSIDPLVVNQGNDYLKGTLSLNFNRSEALFDASGSMNPASIEKAASPRGELFSRYVQFEGPAAINAQGRLDWGSMRTTSFTATMSAPKVELPVAVLDRFSATVTGSGPEIKVSEAAFTLFDGEGSGSLSFLLDPTKRGIPYVTELEVSNINLSRLLAFFNRDTTSSATGNLSGQVQLSADFSQDFYKVANGNGQLKVEDGQLADLPLFRSFSSVMRLILPSFKVFSINSLHGDFRLQDGVIYSDNAYFNGNVISAKGRGSYSHETGFDALVQVQILGESGFSRIFRFFTDPILRLFEIKLEGSLRDPQWKLDKLPDINEPPNP